MTSPARLLLALCATLGASFATLAPVQAAEPELLRIIGEDKKFIVQTAKGPLEITRTMTPCAKNKGWLQPLVPVAGVHPIGEIEILHALNDRDSMLVDMRESQDRVTTALNSSGFKFSYGRTTINLAPADVKKEGPSFDLPLALGILAASEQIETDQL